MATEQKTIAPPPGQAAPAPAAGSAEVQPAGGAAPAPAPSEGGLLGNPLLLMLAVIAPIFILQFFTSRSQQKKQDKLMGELKKGDVVLVNPGLRGKLVEMGDRFAKVEIAPGTKIEVLKAAILGKDSVETASAVERK